MSKSDGCQLHSCEFDEHRPYFRLLCEESWYAFLEFESATCLNRVAVYTDGKLVRVSPIPEWYVQMTGFFSMYSHCGYRHTVTGKS